MIQDVAIEVYEFPSADPDAVAAEIEYAETELFEKLYDMLSLGKRLAVKAVGFEHYDAARYKIVHHRRLEVDVVEEIERRQIRMMVPADGELAFDRPNRPKERLLSKLIGRVPPPLFPKPETVTQYVEVEIEVEVEVPATPWYSQAAAFLRDAWDEAGKIQGCKL